MITLDSIRKPVEEELRVYNEFVEGQFTASNSLLNEMLKYALSSRGKGIRPLLVILGAALNAPYQGAAMGKRVSLAATLVEMIHLSSLIHDDVIDESDTRRGKPSVNARWQSHKAVIVGDYILARILKLGMASAQYDLMNHIFVTIATLCEGEIEQAACQQEQSISRKDYFDIIRKKTASLLSVSISAGALAVHASAEKVEQMRQFGELLGMAFQIEDDILDYMPEANTGKPSCNDLREGKITLPLLLILEKVEAERRQELLERLKQCATDDKAVEYLRCVVLNEGGLDLARGVMEEFMAKAIGLLSIYEDSPYRKSLADLCTYVMQRNR